MVGLKNRAWVPALVAGVYLLLLAWISSGVSLLDDDWGHVRLVSERFPGVLVSSWNGQVGQGGYYRPLTVLSLWVNHLVSGTEPALYHVTNVAIHGLCAGLVFLLAHRLIGQVSVWAAPASALLFLVLPIHTDSIFWIVGRTDSLCAAFYLAALVLFLSYLDKPSNLRLAGLGVCFILALLSKEMALSLPGALLVLGLYRGVPRRVQFGRVVWLLAGLCLLYLLARWTVLGGLFKGVPARNFSVTVWAVQLAKAGAKLGMTGVKASGALVLVATAGVWVWSRKPGLPILTVLAALTVGSLIPVLGQLHNWYLYLPSAFACVALASVWTPTGRVAVTGAMVALIGYYGVILAREGLSWRETSELSESFIQKVIPHARKTSGALYVINVPAAFTPPGSFSGKSILAFALKNATEMSAGEPTPAKIVMVNHVWLTDRTFRCEARRVGPVTYRLRLEEGAYFSFHDTDAPQAYGPDGKTVVPTVLDKAWGRVRVQGAYEIEVKLDLEEGDRVVLFDGESVRLLESL